MSISNKSVSNNYVKQYINKNGVFVYNPISKRLSVNLIIGPEDLKSTFFFTNLSLDELYKAMIPLVKLKLENLLLRK